MNQEQNQSTLFVGGTILAALVGLGLALLVTSPVWIVLLAIVLGITKTN